MSIVVAPDLTSLPFDTLPSLPYRPRLGQRLTLLGAVLIFAGVMLPTVIYFLLDGAIDTGPETFGPIAVLMVAALVSLVVVVGGVRLTERGRQMRALPASELLRRDGRTPMLFLRSFDDDDLIDPTPLMVPLGDFFPRRYEESLARALQPIGPMITIGRPGDKLALLGGGRLFVPDHAWQAAVDYLRTRAAVVVVMVGRSQGIWWEISSCLEAVPIHRLLFFFPYVEDVKRRRSFWQGFLYYHPANTPLSGKAYRRMERERHARYELFRERVQPFLSRPLPPTLDRALFIDFLADGTPRALKTVRPWWWPIAVLTPSMNRMLSNNGRTLQPLIEKLRAVGNGGSSTAKP